VRARLQAATRRDELAQAQASESVLADSLRSLVGFDFTAPIAIEDLLTTVPADDEIERYTETATKTRPEFAQFEADFRAAEQDIKIARAERRPQITYSVNGGFISDSLAPGSLKNSLGIQPSVGVSIPLFDKGASKSREAQARLRIRQAQNARALAERQFAQAFFSARTQAVSARSRVRQIAASITDAEANVAASMARYRAGEASIIEVTDANSNLILQRQAFYQAIFDYQTARARLLRAIGQ
jgi:outer membrane protein TolC